MSIAEQYEQEEKYAEAYLEYKKELSHRKDDVELLTRLGHLALMLEKKEDAVSYFNQIIAHIDFQKIVNACKYYDLLNNAQKCLIG